VYAAPFEYRRASSWGEAVELLAQHGDDARVIAGGQSLVPMMMLRLTEPAVLIDLAGIGAGPVEQREGHLVVPALTRHVELAASEIVRSSLPVVSEATACIGNLRVRNRGTIGGSVAHADPSAELPCLALALGGRVRTLGPAGTRTIAAADLYLGYFQTSLATGEVITDIELPLLPERCGAGFAELTRRVNDFATVEAAAVLTLADDGTCGAVRAAVGAVSHRPLDISDGLASLVGARPTEDALAAAAGAAVADVEIGLTAHGSRSYQRRMLEVFVLRALRVAATRAGGRGDDRAVA
jgi:carbon-monoxide dehydrogenase medium subunit